MMEIRWMNSDVLRPDGFDGLLVKKKKKVKMVKNELIAKEPSKTSLNRNIWVM